MDNEKLAVKVGSIQINNHNIFHRGLYLLVAAARLSDGSDGRRNGSLRKKMELSVASNVKLIASLFILGLST
jgi:hypothetical protein